jgi:(2S)-methylsuccinyl-CoA dehydrogenase
VALMNGSHDARLDLTEMLKALALASATIAQAVKAVARDGGPDHQQVLAYDLAHVAAGIRIAESLLGYGEDGEIEARIACVFGADALVDVAARLLGRERPVGVAAGWLAPAGEFLDRYRDPAVVASLASAPGSDRLEAEFQLLRETFHRFAEERVRPVAERTHRDDTDVPAEIIEGIAAMGGFGRHGPPRCRVDVDP